MQISRLNHVSLLVGDTRRALAFYHDILGLAISTQRPDLGFPGAWLEVGDRQQIHLLELPNPDPAKNRPDHGGRDRHLALVVSDLDELRVRLEVAGLSYTLSRSGRAALFCRDPDGNAIECVQG